jgi:antitoxin HicB
MNPMADVAYFMGLPYTRVLKRHETGVMVASVQELDGCIAHGETAAEALENLERVQAAWLELAIGDGQQVPLPAADEEELPSGRLLVRLPRLLHKKLIQIAEVDDTSLNTAVTQALSEYVARREAREETRQAIDFARFMNQQAAILQPHVAQDTHTDFGLRTTHTTRDFRLIRGASNG